MKKSVFICLCMLSLTACSQLPLNKENPEQRLDRLISEGQYAKARGLLNKDRFKAFAPEYNPRLDSHELQLMTSVVTATDEAISQYQWSDALDIVADAMHSAGKLPALVARKEKILSLRDVYINEHSNNILLQKGEFLLTQLQDRQAIAAALPKNRAVQSDYRELQDEVRTTAEKLFQLAQTSLGEGDKARALRAARLSYQLEPMESAQQMVSELENDRLKNAQRRQDMESKERSKHIDELMAAYEEALKKDDLIRAKSLVDEIKRYSPELSEWLIRVKSVDRRISNKVQADMERGQILYSQGFIQEALDLWKETEKLDPNNERLKEYIIRATKFLENIDKLSEPPPASE